jgi:hypothetical protein
MGLFQQNRPRADIRLNSDSPGMQVSAEISQGKRTVLEQLLSPVQKAVHDAAKLVCSPPADTE